ncbi:MAG: DUF3108 domain-containing protein [Myxococcota bacterium]
MSIVSALLAAPLLLSVPEPPCRGVLPLDTEPEALAIGERLEYELTLGGAYMGKLELSVGKTRSVEGATAVPLFGRLRTNAFVSAIKSVEGRYMAMVNPRTLLPLGVRVEAKVGGDDRWERVRFTDEGRRAETRYLYRGHERTRAYGGDHTLLEGMSLLHFARRVPLEPGLVACQDILSTRRVWRVRAEVMGRETVDTPVGKKRAFRVRTRFLRRRSTAGKTPRPIEIDILIADMPGHPPLAFEMTQSKFKGRAHLVRWKPGRRPS